MRNATRDAAQRHNTPNAVRESANRSNELDPMTKEWLDIVIIPILLKKLRQEWGTENVA
jgi:hypothetical protein